MRNEDDVYWSRVSVCVCLYLAACPHYCTDPDVTWGHGRARLPPSCALFGGFAIGASVALLWRLASGLTPRLYDWSVSSEHLGFFIFIFLH